MGLAHVLLKSTVALVVALVLAPGASAGHGSDCTATAIGLVCRFDGDHDGAPERVHLFSNGQPVPVILDVWRQPGADRVAVGGGAPTPYSPTSLAARVEQYDAGGDGSFEERHARADAWLPSHIGGWGTVAASDPDANGTPDRASFTVFFSHYGSYRYETSTMLP